MTALRTLLLPLVPVVVLAYLPGDVRLRNAIILIPVVLVSTILYPLWHNSRYSPRIWPLSLAVGWAQVLGAVGLRPRPGHVLDADPAAR